MARPKFIAVAFIATCVATTGWAQVRSPSAELNFGIIQSLGFERRVQLVTDPATLAFVEKAGQLLMRNSDAAIPLSFRMVDSEEINVFVVTGFVYATTGLVEASKTEAELAFALAYGAARHSSKLSAPGNAFNMPTAYSLFPSDVISAVPVIFQTPGLASIQGAFMQSATIERGRVDQADILAVRILYDAGYDPSAVTTLFQTVEARSVGRKSEPDVQVHPRLGDRLQKIQKWAAKNLRPREENALTTAEFEKVHRRVADGVR
jgi:predicted Zn-dependent protease